MFFSPMFYLLLIHEGKREGLEMNGVECVTVSCFSQSLFIYLLVFETSSQVF